MNIDQKYYSIFSINLHYQSVKKELSLLKDFLKSNKVRIDSAIDVGCGDGNITEKLREILGLEVIHGLDLNKKLLEQAKKRGIKTICGDMDSIKLKKKFDLVISYGSVHHSDDTNNLIANLKKLSDKYILVVDSTVRNIPFHKITGSKNFLFESSPFCIRSREDILDAYKKNKCKDICVKTNLNANIWHDRSFILARV